MPRTTTLAAGAAEPRTAPRRPTAARLSFVSGGLFLVLLAILHPLRPDVDPSWNVISAYGLGPLGWVMGLAFASLGLACASLVVGLWPHARAKLGRFGLVLLALAAFGCVVAAAFPTDPITTSMEDATTAGQLHSAGASLGGLIPLASILLAWALSKNPRWASARKSIWLATAVVWVGELALIVALATMVPEDGRLGPDVLVGWPNRLMIVTSCAWLMVVARHAAASSGEPEPQVSAGA